MDPSELYELQLELECKRLLPSGRLAEVPCVNPDGLALISAVRYLDSARGLIRVRADASEEIEEAVARMTVGELLDVDVPTLPTGVVLKRNFAGRTGVFAAAPPVDDCGDAGFVGEKWVVRSGAEIVCAAFSARENERGGELSVETLPDRRRQGFARQAASAWGRAIVLSGRTAFYSHDFRNQPSAMLAQSLGIRFCFEAGSFDLPNPNGRT